MILNMSKGFIDRSRIVNSHLDGAAIGLVSKRGIMEARCERIVVPAVLARQGVSFIPAFRLRATACPHFFENHSAKPAAVSVAALAFTSVAVCPRFGVQVLGRRLQCSCISEMPSEGDYLSLEASNFSEGAGNEGEKDSKSTSDQPSFQDIQIDLNLPRRRMLLEFTCNVCGTRTQRLINPDAYRRGTVFVQCAGCEAYHQLVDNLNLIQEFDFRKENDLTEN